MPPYLIMDSHSITDRWKEFRELARVTTTKPGVYQLCDEEKKPLYIGKARNLRNRLLTHFNGRPTNTRLATMLSQVKDFLITPTRTESEALLLEDRLIKEHSPPYNVMLRDDKSYPYIELKEHTFPSIRFHRGPKKKNARYFGPWPSAFVVRQAIHQIQKVFKIRTCTDSVFRNRSRPCLEYQIGNCSAPCVNKITPQAYNDLVFEMSELLTGKDKKVRADNEAEMQQASAAKDFEKAAAYRDRLALLTSIRSPQTVVGSANASPPTDVLACYSRGSQYSIGGLKVRDDTVVDTFNHRPKVPNLGVTAADVLLAYVQQWYLLPNIEIPAKIYLNPFPSEDETQTLEAAFNDIVGRKVSFHKGSRGAHRKWLHLAYDIAEQKLWQDQRRSSVYHSRWSQLMIELGLTQESAQVELECLDVSHHSGEGARVSCVVFGERGPIKDKWRTYKVPTVGGDDYGSLREASDRRYSKLKKEQLARIILIDGGENQLKVVRKVLENVFDSTDLENVKLLAIKKGEGRAAHLDRVIDALGNEIVLQPHNPARHLLQHFRDEAHRSAITSMRKSVRKVRRKSEVENIPLVGPQTRRELLTWFGGWSKLKKANVEDLMGVPGIGKKKASVIYNHLQSN